MLTHGHSESRRVERNWRTWPADRFGTDAAQSRDSSPTKRTNAGWLRLPRWARGEVRAVGLDQHAVERHAARHVLRSTAFLNVTMPENEMWNRGRARPWRPPRSR